MKKSEAKQNTIKFEAGIERLEQIVSALDRNNVELDQALALFAEGIQLIKQCNALLDSAEAKVKVLVEDSSGELIVTENT
ncbi:exodeoxyribonuclease VII small subunit [Dehalobacter sp. DCM]|uniref:exodeoxyribonuclease VII small subunit n=1 Tax=Dehalobacter sp. DCM TaxID=2907827 RepID=UPI003081D74E|nr:exodeoxyribonuclease VII small subunit [Dehalobacter sp. DCM]